MNKKSVYRHIQFIEKDNLQINQDNNDKHQTEGQTRETKNKILAEKIVSQNLNENIGEIQEELTRISEHIKSAVASCETRLNGIINEIEFLNGI